MKKITLLLLLLLLSCTTTKESTPPSEIEDTLVTDFDPGDAFSAEVDSLAKLAISAMTMTAPAPIAESAVVSSIKFASIVTDPSQSDQETRDFRSLNFEMNMCVPAGLPHPRTEYAYLTRAGDQTPSSKWLLDMYGLSVSLIPGTQYVDIRLDANRRSLVEAAYRRCIDTASDGTLFDCPMDCAPGQQRYAVDLFVLADSVYMAGGKQAWLNTGDVYTLTTIDKDGYWYRLVEASHYQLCQIAINLDRPENLHREVSRLAYGATRALDQGKSIVIGVYDRNRLHEEQARQLMRSAPFADSTNFYWHYTTTLNTKASVTTQKIDLVPAPPPPDSGGIYPDLGLLSPFGGPTYDPADNWWNLRVDEAPLDPQSDQIVLDIYRYESTGGRLHPDFGGTSTRYGIPYCVVGNETPLVPVTLGNTSESDKGYPGGPTGYPIPAAAITDPNYIENQGRTDGDRHLLIYHRDLRAAFELSYASYSGGKWSAGYGAVFKLDSNYRRPEGWTSTDAAGLCVMAGLVRYDELYGPDPILHATRCSIKRVGGDPPYVWPASHEGSDDSGGYPLGMRFRLRASFDTSGYPPPIKKLFDSWKVYGLIVADRGGNMYIQGTLDSRWDNGVLNPAFHSLHVRDFEVIQRGWKP